MGKKTKYRSHQKHRSPEERVASRRPQRLEDFRSKDRPRKEEVVRLKALPAAPLLYFSLLTAASSLIFFFLPWYEKGSDLLRGTNLLFQYSQLPQGILEAFEFLGRRYFGYILFALPLCTIATALLYPALLYRFLKALRWILVVLAFCHFWAGLILTLTLLNQERIAHVTFGGYMLFLLLFITSGFQFLALYFLDRHEGIEAEEAIAPWQWVVWFAAVFILTLAHYFYVCYSLISPAPKALIEELRGRFRL